MQWHVIATCATFWIYWLVGKLFTSPDSVNISLDLCKCSISSHNCERQSEASSNLQENPLRHRFFVARDTWPSWFSRFLLHGALVIFVRLLILPFGSFGKYVRRYVFLFFCWKVSLEDVLDHIQMMLNFCLFCNRLPDAVCRARSPEAELLLVSTESFGNS